jgi:hypothetical protein
VIESGQWAQIDSASSHSEIIVNENASALIASDIWNATVWLNFRVLVHSRLLNLL